MGILPMSFFAQFAPPVSERTHGRDARATDGLPANLLPDPIRQLPRQRNRGKALPQPQPQGLPPSQLLPAICARRQVLGMRAWALHRVFELFAS
jgi:hypothetical protein